MIKIKITAFGALGKLTASKPIVIEVEKGSKLSEVNRELKKIILRDFPDFNELEALEKSVLANEEEILNQNHIFAEEANLVILPPICGG